MEEREGKEVYFGKAKVSTYGNRVPGLERPMRHALNRSDLGGFETARHEVGREYWSRPVSRSLPRIWRHEATEFGFSLKQCMLG